MSQLENCIRGLHGRSVALNLTNRRKEKTDPGDSLNVSHPHPLWQTVNPVLGDS